MRTKFKVTSLDYKHFVPSGGVHHLLPVEVWVSCLTICMMEGCQNSIFTF